MSNGKQIAKLLRKAANQHLWDGVCKDDQWRRPGIDALSCAAVMLADEAGSGPLVPAIAFLRQLGVKTWSAREFDEFKRGTDRQGARFLWLHFAALVAEDGGI